MIRYFVALQLGLVASLYSGTALADTWIQIEAQPTLTTATQSARGYSGTLPNVAGFKLSGRWHAIALGPYANDADADAARLSLRAQGIIPNDSFVADGSEYRQAFWPVGGVASLAPTQPDGLSPQTPDAQNAQDTPTTPRAVAVTPQPVRTETLAEARRSETTLDRSEREELQVALKFAGFYKSTIDGSFRKRCSSRVRPLGMTSGPKFMPVRTTDASGRFDPSNAPSSSAPYCARFQL